ncbi:MAG TPA: NAD(P)/FAD-dependent oxidoreductase [Acidimicrobiales bacterium]|nr:NAD(P)/FAD-dependent oxidoreductase [Acidimicrobiales bacterium]
MSAETPGEIPAHRDLRVAIIGGGMSGILSAIKLQEAGFENVTVFEKADGLGGTWRANTYPGISCDVPSHLYRYSFEPNPEWSHTFSPGAEILAYFEDTARRHGVDRWERTNCEVTRLVFDDGVWTIETGDGARDEADLVIAATGVLHHPSYPAIEGLDAFAGPMFHSARWDHSVPLEGRRVGIIGTGSSAVQIVSAVVDTVGQLVVFQRTAQWVIGAPNPPISEDDRSHYRQQPDLMVALRDKLGHQFEVNFANVAIDADSPQMHALEELCTANLESHVKDPVLREKLRPDYRPACKRLVLSPDFYDAIGRPNANLVVEPIERIEPQGVRTAEALHELDILVLATGFRVDRFLRPIEVIGRAGVKLDEVWRDRPCAYLSISIPEFPNLFMLNGPNGPVGNFSLIDVAELQLGYIMQLVGLLTTGRAREISATRQATATREERRVEAAKKTVWMTGCRSWYLDDRGVPAVWPWTFTRFREEMARPDLTEYELVGP